MRKSVLFLAIWLGACGEPAAIVAQRVWETPPIMRPICAESGDVAVLYISHGRTTITPTQERCDYTAYMRDRQGWREHYVNAH